MSQRLIMKNWVMELKSPWHLTVWYLQGKKEENFVGEKFAKTLGMRIRKYVEINTNLKMAKYSSQLKQYCS